MSLLIDADYIVYKCAAAAEEDYDFGNDVIVVTSRFSEAYEMVLRDLSHIANDLGVYDDSVLFFSSPSNFRKKISSTYKGSRTRKKPCGYRRIINKLTEDFPVVVYPDLEADDALGIYSTTHPGNIIVSPDKDLRQIPGDLYNLRDPVEEIQPDDALRWFYIQTMAGDMTDGYSGIPTVGVKRADAILEKNGCSWDTVLNAFLDKDLTKEDALMNARLAKILTKDDYIDGQIKLWDPTDAGDGADAGATIQAESD
ncbi:MAG: T7 exonuclease [Planctomycetota bacterium]|nr:T7 exonuclease [Planctomycetota bacterium]